MHGVLHLTSRPQAWIQQMPQNESHHFSVTVTKRKCHLVNGCKDMDLQKNDGVLDANLFPLPRVYGLGSKQTLQNSYSLSWNAVSEVAIVILISRHINHRNATLSVLASNPFLNKDPGSNEPRREKTGFLPMRKQRRRSAVQ